MRRRYFMGVLAILSLAVLSAGADDFWVKKPSKDWSKAECKKMLEDSPWAKRQLVENSSNANTSLPSVSHDAGANAGMGSAGSGDISYFVQFRSAPPVRMATVRQQQLNQNYDKMSDAEKKVFDAKMDEQMKSIHDDVIALRVTYVVTTVNLAKMVDDYWHSLPPDTVPEGVVLVVDNGKPIQADSFSASPAGETYFDISFPRVVAGAPAIAPGMKSVKLQFQNPGLGDFAAKKISIEFKLDKMMWEGKLTY